MKALTTLSIIVAITFFFSCNDNPKAKLESEKSDSDCSDSCCEKPTENKLVCGLSSPEVQERKATVLASLKKQVLEKKELDNGYSFRFAGTDKLIDELTEFIKSERQCCGFFTFNLELTGDTSSIWLSLTGPQNSKSFITEELGL